MELVFILTILRLVPLLLFLGIALDLLSFFFDDTMWLKLIMPDILQLNLEELPMSSLDLSQLITHDLPVVRHLLDNFVSEVGPQLIKLLVVVEIVLLLKMRLVCL